MFQVRKYLIPDSNDQIRQQQMREIQVMKRMVSEDSPDSGHERDSSSSPVSDTTDTVRQERGEASVSILERVLSQHRERQVAHCPCVPHKRDRDYAGHNKRLKQIQ